MNILLPVRPQDAPRRILFLQGPICPFFEEVAGRLMALGHQAFRINLCAGDALAWRHPGATDYTGRKDDWPAFIERYLAEHAITDIVLLGEQRFYHRAAIAAARPRGITVVATDFGYLRPDWITFERDGLGGDSRFPRDPEAIRALAEHLPAPDLGPRYQDSFPHQAWWDVCYHLASMLSWKFRRYESHQLHHPLRTYLGIGVKLLRRRRDAKAALAALRRAKAAGPLWIFAMQMETDFSIRAYSHYPDMDTPLRETVASFARHAPPDGQLLVKVHPLDPAVKRWPARLARIAAEAGAAGRVHYIAGGRLETLIAAARGLVTVNSTVGLKSITLGCPTLALGKAVYAVPGMVWDGGIERFWTEAPKPDATLVDAFLRALCATVQIRGVYYARPGLDAAVEEAARRLHLGLVNAPLPA